MALPNPDSLAVEFQGVPIRVPPTLLRLEVEFEGTAAPGNALAEPSPIRLEVEFQGNAIPIQAGGLSPRLLEIEFQGTVVTTQGSSTSPVLLEIEFAGGFIVGGAREPYPEFLEIEFQGAPVASSDGNSSPRSLEVEFSGFGVPLGALGVPSPRLLEVEFGGPSLAGSPPAPSVLAIEFSPQPIPGAAPSVRLLEIETRNPTIPAGVLSVLYDLESQTITTLSKVVWVGIPISSNLFPRVLTAKAVVQASAYFSDPFNWKAVFTVYQRVGSEDVLSIRHLGGSTLHTGRLRLKNTDPTGTYHKAVLIEGMNGDLLAVPSVDINEPIIVVT